MLSAIAEAAHIFCDDTLLVQYISSPQPVVTGQSEYQVFDSSCAGENMMLSRVLWVTLDGQDLVPRTKGAIPLSSAQVSSCGGMDFIVSENGVITFLSAPTQDTPDLIACMAITPKLSAVEVPDILLDRYRAAVTTKAKALLQGFDAEWTKPGMQDKYEAEYLDRLREARNEFWDSFSIAEHTLRPGRHFL